MTTRRLSNSLGVSPAKLGSARYALDFEDRHAAPLGLTTKDKRHEGRAKLTYIPEGTSCLRSELSDVHAIH